MTTGRTRPRRTQQQRSEATTGELLAAARSLFAADGYAATSLDAVAAAAGVTKGALYHHFAGKRELFRAVYEAEQRRLGEMESRAYARKRDPWDAFYAACRAFLEASLDPGVQRITLLDAPSALGWEAMREIEAGSLAMMTKALQEAIDAGCIAPRPVEPLARILFGAICETAMTTARSQNRHATSRRMLKELRTVLDALAAR